MSDPTVSPRVSIVIPAYQAAATLERAIQSLQKQSFADWEAIVVDDGSTDDTHGVATRIALADSRVRVLQQTNLGASAARNTGLRAVRGQWIGFLDSDDWFDPAFLKTLLDLLSGAPDAGVVYCDFALVDEKGAIQEEQRVPDMGDPFGELGRSCALSVHCALVRADIMARAGMFDEALAINEDWDLWQRIARTEVPFRGVKQILAFYFTRPNSLSRRRVEDLARDGIEVIERIFRADPNLPMKDPRYANGLPAEERLPIELEWLIMCAGNAIALNIDPLPFLDLVPRLDQAILLPEDAAQTMSGALGFARCVEISALHEQWDALSPGLDAFWAALGARLSDQPRAIDTAQLYLRRFAFGPGAWISGFQSSHIHACRIDLAQPLPEIDPAGREAVIAEIFDGAQSLGLVEIPAASKISPDVLASAIRAAAPFWPNRKQLVKGVARSRLPTFVFRTLSAGARARGWGLKARAGDPRRIAKSLKLRGRTALMRALGDTIGGRIVSTPGSGAWENAIGALAAEAAAQVADVPLPVRTRQHSEDWNDAVEVNSPAYWDQVFQSENPWAYDSPYEQVKYEQTLSLIPAEKPARAIELACAEGHFTVQLAPLVQNLLATDISELAIERAAQRCAQWDHISYQQLDFFNNPVPGEYDLIVCSEVLYEAKTQANLEKIAKNIATHLAPGGALVSAHIIEVAEERDRSGFDWGGVFGSKSITKALLDTGLLQLEEEIETDLYRVQRYRRSDVPIQTNKVITEMGAPPERDYAFHVVWGGTTTTWAEAERERSLAVPILMYHRIAGLEDGPADLAQYRVSPDMFDRQMRWLRQNGYHGITPDEWFDAVNEDRAIPGRPVMLTFDDGYTDFAETAWPILGRFGIPATVAIVTDLVGKTAKWDAGYGPAGTLMDWADIARVSAEGAAIASHSASHRAMTAISGVEVLREALRSRAAIERATGIAPEAVVYPYGIYDPIAARAFETAGYRIGFGTRPDTATMLDDPMHLPRIEVNGFDDLHVFIEKMLRVDLESGAVRTASAA